MKGRVALAAPFVLLLAACGSKGGGSGAFAVNLDPPGTVYTNATVTFTVTTSNGSPDIVQIVKDGTALATLSGPPWTYQFDSTAVGEGPAVFKAEVHRGGKITDSADTTVVVDRTPPHVLSFSPQPFSTNGWSRGDQTVIFTEPLRSSSVFDGGVTVSYAAVGVTSGGTALSGATLSMNGNQATLVVHTGPLPFVPGQVTIDFAPTVTDRAGNPLVVDVPWTFAMPEWNALDVFPPTEAGTPSLPASAVAFDDNPTSAFAVGNHVYVEHWDGVAWALLDPAQQYGTATDAISALAIAQNPMGNPAIAWIENDSTLGQQVFYRDWDGLVWTSSGGANVATATNPCSEVAIALDPSGLPWIAYTQTGTSADVFTNVGSNGNAWGTAKTPEGSTTGSQDQPSIAVDAMGRGLVAWRDTDGIHAARWNGTTWAALGGVIDGGAGQHPRIAAGAGEPFVTYEEGGDVHVKQWDGATSWVAVGGGTVDAVVGNIAKDAHLSLDASGTPVVAWLESDGKPYMIRVAKYDGASAWTELSTPLSLDTTQNVTATSLALDTAGTPFVTFTQAGSVFSRRMNGF